MKNSFRIAIEDNYALSLQNWTPAACGQVATTNYKLKDRDGREFFCKVLERQDFISIIEPTLAVAREMRDRGFVRISAPLPGKQGLAVKVDDALIILYEFIDAEQGYLYDLQILGKTVGDLHNVSSKLTSALPVRGFSSIRADFLTKVLPALTKSADDDVSYALREVLQKYETETQAAIAAFFELEKRCADRNLPFVNTHGDLVGNILVNSPEDFYIVDWDEMENGPAERGLWQLARKHGFMEGYTQVRPGFVPDGDALHHALLKLYLEGIPIYLIPILDKRHDVETRMSYIAKLRDKRLNGWMRPEVIQIIGKNG